MPLSQSGQDAKAFHCKRILISRVHQRSTRAPVAGSTRLGPTFGATGPSSPNGGAAGLLRSQGCAKVLASNVTTTPFLTQPIQSAGTN
jgi:hypothetical protein